MKRQYWFYYVTWTGWLAALIFPPLIMWFWWQLRGQAKMLNKIFGHD